MRRGLPSTANETGVSSGVGKSQQAVLEKIPRARNEDAAAQKPRVGCTRSDQEVGSPWQQRSSNVRLEYKADDLGRAGLVAHRTANRYGAWTRGNSKTQPAAHYVFSGEDLPKCPRKLPYQTAVQRDSPEDRAAAGARLVGACPLWDRLD